MYLLPCTWFRSDFEGKKLNVLINWECGSVFLNLITTLLQAYKIVLAQFYFIDYRWLFMLYENVVKVKICLNWLKYNNS